MAIPIDSTLEPMLARLARQLPADGYLYEPKWDGFRCLAFRDGEDLDLRSRNQRPLARYFPELVEGLLAVPAQRFALDAEILAVRGGRFDFAALLSRLHPAESRVTRLRRETPALLVAFDLLAREDDDLRDRPFAERRDELARLLEGVPPPVVLTPITQELNRATRWLEIYGGHGIDGVVAKHRDLLYVPGRREMIKVKLERTADSVVGGFRWLVDRPLPSSLLLGLYDDDDALRHIGIASSFGEALRRELLVELRPLVTTLEEHPWEQGFLLAGGPTGRLPGAAGRWSPEMEQDWTPVRPERVCEVAFDHVDDLRLRHPARFARWRPDRDPSSCRLEQLEPPSAAPLELLS